MKKFIPIFTFIITIATTAVANQPELDITLQNARTACIPVFDKISALKTGTITNTVVTGVGTVAGGASLYFGISKSKIDEQVDELEKRLNNIENMSDEEFIRLLKDMAAAEDAIKEYNSICAQKKSLTEKSKQYGNLRTGLMATNTATAIAGTILANSNKNKSTDLSEMINECLTATRALTPFMGQAMVSHDNETYTKLKQIIDTCSELNPDDVKSLTSKNKTSMISSAINIGTGTVGTITSAMANSENIRKNDTDSGKSKEKNLNTTANIFAGLSTGASGVATVFNAMAYGDTKDIQTIAKNCKKALEQ